MRTLLSATGMMVILGAVATSQSADRRNFWLLNNTGREIQQFLIAVHGTDEPWSSDVLGRDTLPSGVGVMINFTDNRTKCYYDFRLVFDGLHQDYTEGRNLCVLRGVQFSRDTSIGLQ